VQILDGDYGIMDMAALIREHIPTSERITMEWEMESYEHIFLAARLRM